MPSIVETLRSRGLIQDISDEMGLAALPGQGASFYIGFDPTAPFLHIGNFLQLIVAIHLSRAGLKPLILFGGATGAVGDPSGKNIERPVLPMETIEQNVASQTARAKEILAMQGVEATYVNNYTWTKDVTLLDFLRDIGKHFPMTYMINKEVVKTRLHGEGMSYTEFSYMLLQAFDFLHLYDNHNCRLQFGGSDQWGNITSGLELIRRKGKHDAFAFSVPLITDSQGKKFGKSEGGAVWIHQEGRSPYQFHQFWLNVSDEDAARYLRVFTFLSLEEIASIAEESAKAPEKRIAQQRLADEVTTIIHGAPATLVVKEIASILFGSSSISEISEKALEALAQEIPTITLTESKATSVDLLTSCEVSASKGEARRLIEQGGAYVNGTRLALDTDIATITPLFGKYLLLRSGKKNYRLAITLYS